MVSCSALVTWEEGLFTIRLNRGESFPRQRLVLATALCRLALGPEGQGGFPERFGSGGCLRMSVSMAFTRLGLSVRSGTEKSARPDGSFRKADIRAQVLGRRLLMPDGPFRQAVAGTRFPEDPEGWTLAHRFRVPPPAVSARLEDIQQRNRASPVSPACSG